MSEFRPENPLIVQSDHTILVEVANPHYAEVRDRLAAFAELVKSPEHVHTYRITPLSIWNACAAGLGTEWIVNSLEEFSKYPLPPHVVHEIRGFASRYGRLLLVRGERGLLLRADEEPLAEEIFRHRSTAPLLGERLSPLEFLVRVVHRGRLKQALTKIGFPVRDLAGYREGERLSTILRSLTQSGNEFAVRDYQRAAAEAFYAGGRDEGGSGVVVLPCGAGKTIVGLNCMALVQSSTLILTTGITAARQWIVEILDKTNLEADQVGEYSGEVKQVRPVTVATYNIMTYRQRAKNGGDPQGFLHLDLFDQRNWGLIVYDEVHLLPAPVFQVTASLQARRRLGLTATLVREDGREDDVFSLIGPKKADIPWRELERQGWIAAARCIEIRMPLPQPIRMPYAVADGRRKFRIAAENPDKQAVVRGLLKRHADDRVLVIGTYVDQLKGISQDLNLPLITGATAHNRRQSLFEAFKEGRIPVLAVSKVANFSIDLPDASVAIQVSGTFGSRQEEAQRLGRILRPKPGANQAHFYTLVTCDTVEQDFALKRQMFLCEQGYEYHIRDIEPGGLETVAANASIQ